VKGKVNKKEIIRIREAKQAAQKVLDGCWVRKFPVYIVVIVLSLGIEMFR
jgi:hypothetical protein